MPDRKFRWHWLRVLSVAILLSCAAAASAHETRPAYLELTELAFGRYAVLWRTPLRGGRRLPVLLRLPDGMRIVDEPRTHELADSRFERFTLEVDAPPPANRIEFAGLEASITDVLVRVQHAGDVTTTFLVHPSRPWLDLTSPPGSVAVAVSCWRSGVSHILLGYDHLLFVLALALIVRGTRMLLVTITAFTLAHSVTLALATLDVVRVPAPPVEAVIALSIMLLASEIIRLRRGIIGPTARWPWGIAFAFGLLHGFGFAGALRAMGLPAGDLPLALLAFNVGVETGQLAFIVALVALSGLGRRVAAPVERWVRGVAPIAIGILAAFWFYQRLATFFA